jgi:predicted  nucleic acid-binding Zn-ribbon protein
MYDNAIKNCRQIDKDDGDFTEQIISIMDGLYDSLISEYESSEDSIKDLNDIINEKDDMIESLEWEVRSLQDELERMERD